MAKTLLTTNTPVSEEEIVEKEKYFQLDKLFSELSEGNEEEADEKRATARGHLGILDVEDIIDLIKNDDVFKKYVTESDLTELDKRISKVKSSLSEYAKNDDNVYFTSVKLNSVQEDLEDLEDLELITYESAKKLLDLSLTNYLKANKTDVINWIVKEINDYSEKNLYSKNDLYTADEVDKKDKEIKNLIKDFVARDGSVSFTAPILGRDPKMSKHLATKGYIDKLLDSHKDDLYAHGILNRIHTELKDYALKSNVLEKSKTYSRDEINEIVRQLINDSVEKFTSDFIEMYDPQAALDEIRNENYIKQDGSTPFLNVQKGISSDKPESNDLVTFEQIQKLKSELEEQINNKNTYWITSGDIETTVGFFEDNDPTPAKMTCQEVFDRIFYQKKISIEAPDISKPGSYIDITVCVNNPLDVDSAEIFMKKEGKDWEPATKDGVEIGYIDREEFEKSTCVTKTVGPIDSNTEFNFKIYQPNGTEHNEYTNTKLAYPVFVGIIPKWLMGSQVKYSKLLELSESDSQNNVFYDKTEHMRELEHSYNFDLKEPVKLIVAVPKNYRDLVSAQNDVQTFKQSAFDKVKQTTFKVAGKDVLYKLYIYRQPLVRFDSNVTFKF